MTSIAAQAIPPATAVAIEGKDHLLSVAFHNGPLPTVVTRFDDGTVVEVNEALCALLGGTRGQIIGRSAVELGFWRTPTARKNWMLSFAKGHAAAHSEHWIQTFDGSPVPCQLTVNTLRVGLDRYLICGLRDLSEELKTTRRALQSGLMLEAALSCMSDAVCIVGPDNQVMHFNDAFVRLHRFESREACEVALQDLQANFEIFEPGGRKLPVDEWPLERSKRGESAIGTEYEVRRKGSDVSINCAVSYSPVTGPNGEVNARIITVRDVSKYRSEQRRIENEQQRLEAEVRRRTSELAAATRAAESANQAKTAFLANISHEIRTPLHAIGTITTLMRSLGVTSLQDDCLQKLEAASAHLVSLIESVLSLSQIEAGRLELEERTFNLRTLLDAVAAITVDQANRAGLRLSFSCDCDATTLFGDPIRIQQALLNYIVNAIKFTPQGGVAVNVSVSRTEGARRLIRFEVADTGIGIDPVSLPRLFTPFEQAHTDAGSGSGLGLAITRRLARLMGGDANADSEPGRGSLFWFTAWVRTSQVARNAGRSPGDSRRPERSKPNAWPKLSGRILLTEDDEVSREMLKMLLERVGLTVDCAGDGIEAARMARTSRYQLILMDMRLPRMDGPAAAAVIGRESGSETPPIIALTANAFERDRQRCIEAGMSDFLSKPIAPSLLFERIAYWLGERDPAGSPYNPEIGLSL